MWEIKLPNGQCILPMKLQETAVFIQINNMSLEMCGRARHRNHR